MTLEQILAKDKYLRLSHYLELNRLDWNDGSSFAEAGLIGFKVETAQDYEIFAEITGLIDDWQDDGRVFRDCKWSYTKIAELADRAVVEEYNAFMEANPIEYDN